MSRFPVPASAVLLVLAFATPGHAADMAVKSPVRSVYDWTGFYFGVNAGVGVGRDLTQFAFTGSAFAETSRLGPSGAFGGGQIGYNVQTGNFGLGHLVFGVEADLQGANLSDRGCGIFAIPSCSVFGVQYSQKLGWFGTVRGRLGIASGDVLSYVTGGYAYGNVETFANQQNSGPFGIQENRGGWTVGSGIEAALGGNWTGKIEYLYVNFGTQTAAGSLLQTPAQFSSDIREHIFRVGVNYRVGGGNSVSPPVANWAGLYVGGNAGSAIARNQSTFGVFPGVDPGRFTLSPKGLIGGVQAGYNWQANAFVLGLEADIQGSTQRDNQPCIGWCGPPAGIDATFDQKMSWLGTVRGRVGYATGSSLFYATGGLAAGKVRTDAVYTNAFFAPAPSLAASFDHTLTGFVVGGGIESTFDLFGWFGPNWTSKTEYLFADLGSVSNTVLSPTLTALTTSSRVQEHIFRTGLNYHFNGPVTARY